MYNQATFEQCVTDGNPTGEIVGVSRFLIKVKGLAGVPVGALILFETGQRGLVREINAQMVTVLSLDSEAIDVGTVGVLQDRSLSTPVGESLIGRVITALGQPIDGKGPIEVSQTREVFSVAPGIAERKMLKDQLTSGVAMVDMLFPIVLGQRIAVMGDAKSGKTSFLLQLGQNQIDTGRIVVYVLIGKRRVDIDQLVDTLNQTGAMAHSIVVVASIFDSLAQSYIAPYVGCAIAEHLWLNGHDTIITYDDLSSHAKVYREVSLLSRVNPGRDSYPGDMFFAHSSLLERAGKLASNDKTLTALPIVITPGDDITMFLPTSIMSITDGQLVFDLRTFRENIRPAINIGLSVSRVGGRAQSEAQKQLTGTIFKQLAAYRQAKEFAHFGSELTPETRQTLDLGRYLYEALQQPVNELRPLAEQQMVFRAIMKQAGKGVVSISGLKQEAKTLAGTVTDEKELIALSEQLGETSDGAST